MGFKIIVVFGKTDRFESDILHLTFLLVVNVFDWYPSKIFVLKFLSRKIAKDEPLKLLRGDPISIGEDRIIDEINKGIVFLIKIGVEFRIETKQPKSELCFEVCRN